jgi:hypothetical protein
VSVTPDGRRAVSGSEDQTLKVWDLETGQEMGSTKPFPGEVLAVVLAPDGRTLAVAIDQVVQIWDLEQLVAQGPDILAPSNPVQLYALLPRLTPLRPRQGEPFRLRLELVPGEEGPLAFEIPPGTRQVTGFITDTGSLILTGPATFAIALDSPAGVFPSASIDMRGGAAGDQEVAFELHFGPPDNPFLIPRKVLVPVGPTDAEVPILQIRPVLNVRVAPDPDLVLTVDSQQPGGVEGPLRLSYRLSAYIPGLELEDAAMGTVELPADYAERLQDLLSLTLQTVQGASPSDVRQSMLSVGAYLWASLVPPGLALREAFTRIEQFWQDRQGSDGLPPTCLILQHTLPWLPWELVAPHQEDEVPTSCLAERYRIGRWIEGLGRTLYGEVPLGVNRDGHVVMALTNYEHIGDREKTAWEGLLGAKHVAGILEMTDPGNPFFSLHLLHYLRSGEPALGIRRRDGTQVPELLKDDLATAREEFNARRPVITVSILGGDDGRVDGRTFIDPRALAGERVLPFLRSGASVLVVPWWPTSLAADQMFWRTFYSLLIRRTPLGEAVWRARWAVHLSLPESPDWLAYTLFGDPRARCYYPEPSDGYTALECTNPEDDGRFHPDKTYRFEASIRRRPPVWFEDRLVQIPALPERARVRFLAPDLIKTSAQDMQPDASFSMLAATIELKPPEPGEYALMAQFYNEKDEHMTTLQVGLDVVQPTKGDADG